MTLILADAWLHTLDSVVVSLGPVKIRWYGLAYVLGFVLGAMLIRFLARRGATPIPADRALDVVMWLVAGVLIGGRLGYALFYRPSLFIGFTADFPFWDLLALHKGGMASHGGMIGVCIAAWRIRRGWASEAADTAEPVGRAPWLHVTDIIALIATPGLALGRLANFINGELLGKIVARPGEPGPWWAVRYWQEAGERWEHLPLEQRLRIAESAGMPPSLVVMGDEDAVDVLVGYIASLAEAARAGSAEASALLAELLNARHPTQLYQALAEGVVTGLVIWWLARSRRTPGVVGAWFLILYGLGRIATEFVRLPDSHLVQATLLGLSRGQWLSMGMVAFGAGVLWWVKRPANASTPRMLGWAQPQAKG